MLNVPEYSNIPGQLQLKELLPSVRCTMPHPHNNRKGPNRGSGACWSAHQCFLMNL